MFDNIRISIDHLDEGFIDKLKEQYPHASLEIKVEPSKPDNGLTEEQFWSIIETLDWSKSPDNESVIEPAVKKLASLPVRNIYEFQDRLSEKLHHLDTRAHAEKTGENAWGNDGHIFSADEFLYARCCVVANGEKAYEPVLNMPEKMPQDLTFEALLRLARKAYFQKTGKEFRYVPAQNMETFANKSGWQS